MAMNPIELHKAALRLNGERVPFCLVTVVDARGSIPQELGAKAIIGHNGLIHGTVGGGKVEVHACAKSLELLNVRSHRKVLLEPLNLNRDIGMTCAGEMTLLYEVWRPDLAWHIVIFGAGHVAQKLCRLLVELDCRVTCFDTRTEWLDRLPDHEMLQRRQVASFVDGVTLIEPGAYVVVMTMGHSTDRPVLTAIAEHKVETAFVGTLGSDAKAAILRREFKEAGISEDFIGRLHCPIGEKFGNNTPAEIAVSVLAQLLRVRDQPQ